jgi:pyrroline-5-carboxylate reductase
MTCTLVFIGGGNMASAILGGLLKSAPRPALPAAPHGGLSSPAEPDPRKARWTPAQVCVVEPFEAQRAALVQQFGVRAIAAADASLAGAQAVVWAVKPQSFAQAAAPCRPFVSQALHLSVMAGIRSDALARATGSERIVRAMPNTPALIGQGISGLFARAAVTPPEREQVQALLAPTGATLWVDQEADLDAVTALSGSGPAYVFFFLEAMVDAAQRMGLSAEQGTRLALATFGGATEMAQRSTEPLARLRERVTSKGGTTQAALQHMAAGAVQEQIVAAVIAARDRARELGAEFGA